MHIFKYCELLHIYLMNTLDNPAHNCTALPLFFYSFSYFNVSFLFMFLGLQRFLLCVPFMQQHSSKQSDSDILF